MSIEQAFRDLKSHGWPVEQAALSDPQRLARLSSWLLVAYPWMLLPGATFSQLGQTAALKRSSIGPFVRQWSLFRQGRPAFLAATPPP